MQSQFMGLLVSATFQSYHIVGSLLMSEIGLMKYEVYHISRVELILMIFQVLCKNFIFNLEICCIKRLLLIV